MRAQAIPSQEMSVATAARIATLLHRAAEQVGQDIDVTRASLAEVSTLIRALPASGSPATDKNHALAPWQARRVRAFIDDHVDQPIRVDALAAHVRLSVRHFFRAFRGTFGIAPHAFVMRCRTDRAMLLLGHGDDPIAQIATACGFADQAHFSRVFARRFGLPPAAWRRSRQVADHHAP